MVTRIDAGDSMLGQRFSSFRIESRLGAGSLGIVYRAVNEDDRRDRRDQGGALAVQRHLARPVAFGRDPCPVSTRRTSFVSRRVGQDYGATFLVMEFIAGPTFADVLAERGALPWPEVVGLGLQICDALEHMHDAASCIATSSPRT